jgi:hypothetical protein
MSNVIGEALEQHLDRRRPLDGVIQLSRMIVMLWRQRPWAAA